MCQIDHRGNHSSEDGCLRIHLRASRADGVGFCPRSCVREPCGLVIALLVGVTLCMPQKTSGCDWTAEEVIAALVAASEAIQTVECRYRIYYEGADYPGGLTEQQTGWGFNSEYDWAWERATGREAMEGYSLSRGQKPEGATTLRQAFHLAYDGHILKEFEDWADFEEREQSQKGWSIRPVENKFTLWKSPLVPIGRDIGFRPLRSLSDLLHGAELIEDPEAADDLLVLRSRFMEAEEIEMIVWVDPTIGFLCRRIKQQRDRDGQALLKRLYEVEEALEVSPGVWFPVRGRSTYYFVKGKVPPDGVTEAEARAMSKEELQALYDRAKYEVEPLGMGTCLYVTDPQSIRVNHKIDDARFTFDFPPGTQYWDYFKQEAVTVPGGPPPVEGTDESAEHSRGLTRGQWLLIAANAILIVCVIGYVVRKRRNALPILLLGLLISGCGVGQETGTLAGDSRERMVGAHPTRQLVLRSADGPAMVNLGVLEGGTRINFTFRVVNVASTPIRLAEELFVNCGCAGAKLSKTELLPKEECELTLEVVAPTTTTRNQSVFAIVPVLEPEGKDASRFGVVFHVEVPWKTAPTEFRLLGQPGAPQEVEFRVFRNAARDLRILNVSSDLPDANIQYEDVTIRDERGARIHGTFALPAELGTHEHSIHIETDDESIPEHAVPVICRVLPKYQIVPHRVLVSGATEAIVREVTIRSHEEFAIHAVDTGHAGLAASAKDSEPALDQVLLLQVDPSHFAPGFHQQTVSVTLASQQGEETVTLPALIVRR